MFNTPKEFTMNINRLIERYNITSTVLDETVHEATTSTWPAYPIELHATLSRLVSLDSDERVEMTGYVFATKPWGYRNTDSILDAFIEMVGDEEIDWEDPSIDGKYVSSYEDFISWFDNIDPRDIDGNDSTLREVMGLGESTQQGNASTIGSYGQFSTMTIQDEEYLLVPSTNRGLDCSLIEEANFDYMLNNYPEVQCLSTGPYLDHLGIDLDELMSRDRLDHLASLLNWGIDYPIIEEQFYSNFEENERREQWEQYDRSEFVKVLCSAHNDRFDNHEELDPILNEEMENLADSLMAAALNDGRITAETNGFSFSYDGDKEVAREWAASLPTALTPTKETDDE